MVDYRLRDDLVASAARIETVKKALIVLEAHVDSQRSIDN